MSFGWKFSSCCSIQQSKNACALPASSGWAVGAPAAKGDQPLPGLHQLVDLVGGLDALTHLGRRRRVALRRDHGLLGLVDRVAVVHVERAELVLGVLHVAFVEAAVERVADRLHGPGMAHDRLGLEGVAQVLAQRYELAHASRWTLTARVHDLHVGRRARADDEQR